MRRAAAVLAAVALAIALVPGESGGAIRLERSVAGISLDMTRSQVERELGRADVREVVESERLGRVTKHRYRSRHLTVSIPSGDDRVISVFTRNRAERTAAGVGVGSSEQEVRRGLSGEECESRRGRLRSCFTGGAGGAHTIFRFRARRVSSVELRKTVGEQ